MEPRMVKAGIVAAVSLTLLVPTFNALNLSYVENVQPPPWMPTPKDPPNITPPTDFEPPPDFEPPSDWEGEVPPGACPPPVERVLNETRQSYRIPGPQPEWEQTLRFQVPEGTVAMMGYVNFTQWRASGIALDLSGPDGFAGWQESAAGSGGGLLGQAQPRTDEFEYASFEGDDASPVPAGNYVLRLRAELPMDGTVTTLFGVALACGGMMSS